MKNVKHQEKIIELKNVSVRYREQTSFFKSKEYQALKDISFDVYRGEVLGVIGRNGAGKSTLLRLLAGIIKPDGGEVIHHTKKVSLMAMASGFDPNLSGRNNAIVSGMLMGYSRKYIERQLESIKIFSELQDFFEKPTKSYSSGMLARLAFSISMYVSPEVLLIDEVLGVGDASFRSKAEMALEDKFNSDITVIIVSHSQNQITQIANRIVWIDGGIVRKQGLADDIFPEYNLNNSFSTFNLKIESYVMHDDFFILLEPIIKEDMHLLFNAVLFNRNDSRIFSVECVDVEGSVLSVMSGPSATPGISMRYPEISSATQARFHLGKLKIGKVNKLIINGEQVLELKVQNI